MQEFDRLVEIIQRLRGPGGCPWDAQQTHKSLGRYAIEEAYELLDAIDNANAVHIKEELGDLLLQVVLHSAIASENSEFSIEDVINGICEKLVYRHPHVFGDTQVKDAHEVKVNWEKLKNKEKGVANSDDIFSRISTGLPSLIYARKVVSAASGHSMAVPDERKTSKRLNEELHKALKVEKDDVNAEQVFGQLMLYLTILARSKGVDLETALKKSCNVFTDKENKAPGF